MFVVNGAPGQIQFWWGSVEYTDHLSLIRGLIASCDSCLLVSPFLYREFDAFFDGVNLTSCHFELITSCAPRGQDQFDKPFALRSFGRTTKAATGLWPAISINQALHSKIYIFSRRGAAFVGIVTSANFTDAGLSRNHETGVVVSDESDLKLLMGLARTRVDYVKITEDQINRLCAAVEAYESRYPRDMDDRDVDLGLKNILNTYTTPSAENRNAILSSSAFYYIKVSGVKDRPILPEGRRKFDDPRTELDFAKSPDGVRIGDCLLDVAVGGKCFLSYYACASEPHLRTEKERADDPDYQRWPYYVYANNLSLHYGAGWFDAPLYYESLIREFKSSYPEVAVTAAGGDNLMGAIQMGNSYFKVTSEFGRFVRAKIDAFVPPSANG